MPTHHRTTPTDQDFSPYLAATTVIDWRHPAVLAQAAALADGLAGEVDIAKACFEWVRDQVHHSVDHQLNPVTCRASDVLIHRTGYCYAKSHLLAALLRASGIPAGFCYQRLSIDDNGAPYCLHGLNAVYLKEWGWYRIDPRGNRPGINAQFSPPVQQLAFTLTWPEEKDFPTIWPAPLPWVIETLTHHDTWQAVLQNLPDWDGFEQR